MKPWDPDFQEKSEMFAPLAASWLKIRSPDWPDPGSIAPESGLRFATQEGKLSQKEYERKIHAEGEIPTRKENWHDFFNMLVWLAFPKTKREINRLHVEEDRGAGRTALQNALTHFDESGLVVAYSEPEVASLIADFEWKKLFLEKSRAMEFFLFGHGLYEKALAPYLGMTGKALLFPVAENFFLRPMAEKTAQIDEMVAKALGRRLRFPADLAPIPLLGFPGWHPGNGCESFFDNESYFRTGRNAQSRHIFVSSQMNAKSADNSAMNPIMASRKLISDSQLR